MIVAEKFFERVQCVRGIFYLQCVNVLVTEEFASLKLDGNRNTWHQNKWNKSFEPLNNPSKMNK